MKVWRNPSWTWGRRVVNFGKISTFTKSPEVLNSGHTRKERRSGDGHCFICTYTKTAQTVVPREFSVTSAVTFEWTRNRRGGRLCLRSEVVIVKILTFSYFIVFCFTSVFLLYFKLTPNVSSFLYVKLLIRLLLLYNKAAELHMLTSKLYISYWMSVFYEVN